MLYVFKRRLTVDRCKGRRCSLTKKLLPAGFIRARSFSQAPIARSSSDRSGCVVDRPRFNRATCKTRLSLSTWSSLKRQASETLRPCRNIRSKRQRSRASFRLPLAASISRSTSRLVRCFRPLSPSVALAPAAPCFPVFRAFIILSRVSPVRSGRNPCKQRVGFFNYRQNVPFCRGGSTGGREGQQKPERRNNPLRFEPFRLRPCVRPQLPFAHDARRVSIRTRQQRLWDAEDRDLRAFANRLIMC